MRRPAAARDSDDDSDEDAVHAVRPEAVGDYAPACTDLDRASLTTACMRIGPIPACQARSARDETRTPHPISTRTGLRACAHVRADGTMLAHTARETTTLIDMYVRPCMCRDDGMPPGAGYTEDYGHADRCGACAGGATCAEHRGTQSA